jgi:hypothetical protein
VVLLGVTLRAAHFLHGRGLWSDEVRLALNILSRSFAGLLHPLDYDQVAPIPFLWLTRATILIGGPSPNAFRLWPCLAGLLLLVVMRRLAFRLLPAGPALLATALVALSPVAIYYSAELKPYSVDALLAAGLIALALRVLEAPTDSRRWRLLLAAGAMSVLCSISAIMVLAAIGLGLLASPEIRSTRTGWVRLLSTGAVWLLVFLPAYVFVYHPGSSSAMMASGWERHYLAPGSPDLAFRADYLARTIFGRLFSVTPIGPYRFSPVTSRFWCVLVVAGLVFLARRKGLAVALCVAGPIIMVLLSSAARLYPLWPRLVLFTLPSLALLVAEGTWGGLGLVLRGRWVQLLGLAASLLLVAPAVRTGFRVLLHPIERDETGRLLAAFSGQSEPTDPVYVATGGIPSWVFHTTDWSAPDTTRLAWMASLATSGGESFLNQPSRGHIVRHEGWEERRQLDQRIELMGIASGVTTSYMPPFTKPISDTGWAANEADRMVAEARPRVWIFNTDLDPRQYNELRTALVERGGHETRRIEEPGASLSLFIVNPRAARPSTASPVTP